MVSAAATRSTGRRRSVSHGAARAGARLRRHAQGRVKGSALVRRRQLEDGRTLALVRTSKDGRQRIVPCTRTMVEVLARQRERPIKGDDRVFPVTPMTLRRRWEEARTIAGLEDVTLHDLRRTHGTHAAAGGVDLRTLADRFGHADLTMLQRHYAAVVGTAAAEAAETIQAPFDRTIGAAPNPTGAFSHQLASTCHTRHTKAWLMPALMLH